MIMEPGALERAIALLRGSTRRVIWAGGGVIRAAAAGELRRLAEALEAPVVTTVNGRGALPEDHALCLGALSADPRVAAALAEAEVVLAVGTRFQAGATRNFTLAPPDGGAPVTRSSFRGSKPVALIFGSYT